MSTERQWGPLTWEPPQELGYYSIDTEGKYHQNKSQQKCLHLPPDLFDVDYDLNAGYGDADMSQDVTCKKLDDLLRWITDNHKQLIVQPENEPKRLPVDFVCNRRLLVDLMCSSHDNCKLWICATKYKGTIYLCELFSKEKQVNRAKEDRKQIYWSEQFKSYFTSTTNVSCIETDSSDRFKGEFRSVLQTRMKTYSFLFSAEIDCLDPNPSLQDDNPVPPYVELKTNDTTAQQRRRVQYYRRCIRRDQPCSQPELSRKMDSFKLLRIWAECYLSGIQRIYCGFLNKNGVVVCLEEIRTSEIPKMQQINWIPKICEDNLECLISYFKHHVTKDDPNVIYKFSFNPGSYLICKELTDRSPEFTVLPDWYIEHEIWQ